MPAPLRLPHPYPTAQMHLLQDPLQLTWLDLSCNLLTSIEPELLKFVNLQVGRVSLRQGQKGWVGRVDGDVCCPWHRSLSPSLTVVAMAGREAQQYLFLCVFD